VILNDINTGRVRKARKRVGRGPGSGHGKTSGRGSKGAKARTGHHLRPMFAGNSVPFFMRFPKRGMGKRFVRSFAVVNISDLARYKSGETVDPARLKSDGLLKVRGALVKVLGDGRIEAALTVQAHAFSKSAEEKITAAGGTVVRIESAQPAASSKTGTPEGKAE